MESLRQQEAKLLESNEYVLCFVNKSKFTFNRSKHATLVSHLDPATLDAVWLEGGVLAYLRAHGHLCGEAGLASAIRKTKSVLSDEIYHLRDSSEKAAQARQLLAVLDEARKQKLEDKLAKPQKLAAKAAEERERALAYLAALCAWDASLSPASWCLNVEAEAWLLLHLLELPTAQFEAACLVLLPRGDAQAQATVLQAHVDECGGGSCCVRAQYALSVLQRADAQRRPPGWEELSSARSAFLSALVEQRMGGFGASCASVVVGEGV